MSEQDLDLVSDLFELLQNISDLQEEEKKKPGEILPCQPSSKYQLFSAGQSSMTFHLRFFLYPHRRKGREHLGLDVFLKCKKLLDNGL